MPFKPEKAETKKISDVLTTKGLLGKVIDSLDHDLQEITAFGGMIESITPHFDSGKNIAVVAISIQGGRPIIDFEFQQRGDRVLIGVSLDLYGGGFKLVDWLNEKLGQEGVHNYQDGAPYVTWQRAISESDLI